MFQMLERTGLTVGEKLKRARKFRKPSLTQEEFAEHIGVNRSTLSRYEVGAVIPDETLKQIAERLKIPLGWFLDGRDSDPPYGAVTLLESLEGTAVNPRTLGTSIALPMWAGIVAGHGQECYFNDEETAMQEVPLMLLGHNEPAKCRVFRISGSSMAPRVEHSHLGIVALTPDASINTLVMASRSDGALFVKALRPGRPPQPYSLHSVNSEAFPPIEDVTDWRIVGSVIAFMAPPVAGDRNIEWNFGRPLRA